MATIDEQYLQIISDQRGYLNKLQEAFNTHCDQITKEAEDKLAQIPATDTEARKKILIAQKTDLDKALNEFKQELNYSNGKIRKKLEELYTQKEVQKLDNLEAQIQKI